DLEAARRRQRGNQGRAVEEAVLAHEGRARPGRREPPYEGRDREGARGTRRLRRGRGGGRGRAVERAAGRLTAARRRDEARLERRARMVAAAAADTGSGCVRRRGTVPS